MNANKKQLEEWAELDTDSIDFDDLESKLDSELEEQMVDLEGLEADREKIGNPDTIGHTVMNVVWEQFINQVGIVAGEDFIKENRGLTLDLRKSSHIQTGENFKKAVELDGKIVALTKKVESGEASVKERVELQRMKFERSGLVANHNRDIDYKKRYDGYQSNFQYDEDGNIITQYDRIDEEDKAILKPGYREPFDTERIKDPKKVGSASIHMDETVSIGELSRDPEVNAHMDKEDIIAFDISDDNLNPMSGPANESKNDHKAKKWLESERKGQRPADRFDIDEEQIKEKDEHAREVLEEKVEKGRKESEETGKDSIKAEAKLIGGKALRSVVMGLLASLIKDIVRKLISWFRSGNRKLSTFIDSVKEAIKTFVSNLKEHLLNASNTLVTTISTAIFGPVIGMIKKAWIFLKQGYKSIKEAIKFLKNPANKNMPFSLKMMEVGKIVIVGLTAGGAIVLSEVIEKGLMSIPGFAFEIPLLGSLASLIGMFLGALVSGLIGALALNLIDKLIAKKLKKINTQQQIEKKNEILATQGQLNKVVEKKVEKTRNDTISSIKERHAEAADIMKDSISKIMSNSEDIDAKPIEDAEIIDESENGSSKNNDALDSIFDDLKSLS